MRGKVVWLTVSLAWWLASLAVAAPIGKTDEEVRSLAEPIAEGLLRGFNEGDYRLYAQNFDDALKEAIPERKFHQVREEILKKLGSYRNKQYLGFLTQQPYTVVLWKGSFAGTADDILIKLVLSRRQEVIKVVGLWFQ